MLPITRQASACEQQPFSCHDLSKFVHFPHTPPNLLWPFGLHFDCPRGRGQGYPWKFFLGLCGPVLQIQILHVCQLFFLYDNYNCVIASLIMLFFSYHSSYRELKQLRWWPHWRLKKNNRFNDQNNSSAQASRFLVHFFDVHCMTTTWNLLIWCFMEDVDIWWRIFQPLFEPE